MKSQLPGSTNPTPTFREEETMIPCPLCKGSGRKFRESETGSYYSGECLYCDALGMVTISAWRAWHALRPEVQRDLSK